MKPDIDLNNPLVKDVISLYSSKIEMALNVSQNIEKSIIPIYAILKSDKKLSDIPQQIGSGVLVNIKDEYFIFSASHVFDDIGDYQLLTGSIDGTEILSLAGDRFSSKKGESGTHEDDPIDASVFHIQSPIPENLKKIALSLEDFDYSHSNDSKVIHFAAGFRAKKSKNVGNGINSKRECFPSIEIKRESYKEYKLDSKIHIALACEKQVIINGRWQLAPKLNGISGGAIIKISGISMDVNEEKQSEPKQLLTAIVIQHLPEKNKKAGILIGTRVGVHLGLIHKFLPDLLEFE